LSPSMSLFFLPKVDWALSKGFAECPRESTRQTSLCRLIFCRVRYAECGTRQRLCRVLYGLLAKKLSPVVQGVDRVVNGGEGLLPT
jgi:hypothetical protein